MASAAFRCPSCSRPVPKELFADGVTVAWCPHCGHALSVKRRPKSPPAATAAPAAAPVVAQLVPAQAPPVPAQAPASPAAGVPPLSSETAVPSLPLHFPPPIGQTSAKLRIAIACIAGGAVLVTILLLAVLWTRASRHAAEAASNGTQEDSIAGGPLSDGSVLPAASPAAEQGGQKPGETDVCYRWKQGEQYSYRISCKTEVGNVVIQANGTSTYTVGRSTPAAPAAADPSEARKGSGTAFVVSADGCLVTCAHVVRNATEIQVTLGGQATPCQVLARDDPHDLALLRIPRKGLSVLPLADSEAVELAEEVRAIGFPLSDILGSSLKVTQGSVAGIAAQRRGKIFQIDAVVNPGNSGGPLVDGRGAVIGVVSAQLIGREISKVGFAVPVNYAKSLLEKHRVAFQAAAGGAKLDGPTLARRAAPAVALVTMTCRGDDSGGHERVPLEYHAVLDTLRQNRSGASVFSQSEPSQRDDGRLVTDQYGEIFESNGRVHLPGLLGPLASAVIDPLPSDGESTWQRQEMLTLSFSTRGSGDTFGPFGPLRPPGMFGPRFPGAPPIPFGPFAAQPQTTSTHPAILQIGYTMEEPKGTTVLIRKHLELRTLEKAGSGPMVELTGNGETVFDLKAGVPEKVTFSGTFTAREGGDTTQGPVSLSCERMAAGVSPSAPAASPPAVAAAPSPPESAESAKARLDRFLSDLREPDKDWGKCFQALQGLAMMPPIESRRGEVAEVLDAYLAEKNYSARSSALRAVQVWGTKRNVPALIALLAPSEGDSVRQRTLQILAKLPDKRAAEAVAKLVKNPSDRALAARALRAIGRDAEGATIGLLADEDPDVRVEACNVLGEIGGPKSAAALKEQLAKDAHPDAKAAAKAALGKLANKP